MFDVFNPDVLDRIGIPRTYFKTRTVEYRYWFRNLLQRIESALVFKGLPKEWPEDYWKFLLYATGKVAVFNTARFGTTFSVVTALSGYDFYFQPTEVSISSPYYTNILTMHKDVELVKLNADFMGVWDLIDHYASKLAEISKGIDMGIKNSKVPLVIFASDKSQSESIKMIYDEVMNGESLVVWKDKLNDGEVIPRKEPLSVWSQNFKETYVVTELLTDYQTILDDFFMTIGIPKQLNKKAHVLSEEADFQGLQSQCLVATWINNLEESFKRVEDLFGLHLEVQHVSNDLEELGLPTAQDGEGSESKLDSRK